MCLERKKEVPDAYQRIRKVSPGTGKRSDREKRERRGKAKKPRYFFLISRNLLMLFIAFYIAPSSYGGKKASNEIFQPQAQERGKPQKRNVYAAFGRSRYQLLSCGATEISTVFYNIHICTHFAVL